MYTSIQNIAGNKSTTIIIVLVILWLPGRVTSCTMGGLIHVLLVIAIVVILLRVIALFLARPLQSRALRRPASCM
jgi:hypothetical protein